MKLVSQCDRKSNCLSRSFHGILLACCWDVKQPTNKEACEALALHPVLSRARGAVPRAHRWHAGLVVRSGVNVSRSVFLRSGEVPIVFTSGGGPRSEGILQAPLPWRLRSLAVLPTAQRSPLRRQEETFHTPLGPASLSLSSLHPSPPFLLLQHTARVYMHGCV